MELKTYQRQVIADLEPLSGIAGRNQSPEYRLSASLAGEGRPTLGVYQDVCPAFPHLCFKVPTGGGKTFLACNAVRPMFDALPQFTKAKAVVGWCRPDAILTQTAKP